MDFGELLKAERKAANQNQEQLAKRSGVSLHAIRSYETGRRKPSAEALFALCEALGVSCEKFKPERQKPRKGK